MEITTTIEIDSDIALRIVIADLIKKYQSNITRANIEWVMVFEKILRYYLDENEMVKLRTAIYGDTLPDNPLEIFDYPTGGRVTR